MMSRRGLFPLLLLVAGGCPRPPLEPPVPVVVAAPPAPMRLPVPPDEDVLPSVLRSAGWALALPRERQVEEVERWRAAVDRDGLPSDRLRLALLLTLGEDRDPEQVQQVLQGQYLAGDLASETLARLLLQLADADRRQRTEAARFQRELTESEAQLDELRGKLEALGAIEIQMHEREMEE